MTLPGTRLPCAEKRSSPASQAMPSARISCIKGVRAFIIRVGAIGQRADEFAGRIENVLRGRQACRSRRTDRTCRARRPARHNRNPAPHRRAHASRKNVDGRIDDPNAGWKGRGIGATFGSRAPFHNEGGTQNSPKLYKVQMRPDPLAN